MSTPENMPHSTFYDHCRYIDRTILVIDLFYLIEIIILKWACPYKFINPMSVLVGKVSNARTLFLCQTIHKKNENRINWKYFKHNNPILRKLTHNLIKPMWINNLQCHQMNPPSLHSNNGIAHPFTKYIWYLWMVLIFDEKKNNTLKSIN